LAPVAADATAQRLPDQSRCARAVCVGMRAVRLRVARVSAGPLPRYAGPGCDRRARRRARRRADTGACYRWWGPRWVGAGLPAAYPLYLPSCCYRDAVTVLVPLRPSAAAASHARATRLRPRLPPAAYDQRVRMRWVQRRRVGERQRSGRVGPFLLGVNGLDSDSDRIPDEDDQSYLGLGVGSWSSTCGWALIGRQRRGLGTFGYTLGMSGPGVLETRLALSFAPVEADGSTCLRSGRRRVCACLGCASTLALATRQTGAIGPRGRRGPAGP
jgi:hypothetical protein